MSPWGSRKAPSRLESPLPEKPYAWRAEWTVRVFLGAVVIFWGLCGQAVYLPPSPSLPSSLLTLN
jgi:hypothetical protein